VHLSRWSEELVLWSTPMFGFVTLPTASARQLDHAQKKNPDVPELVLQDRRVIGDLAALLVLMKRSRSPTTATIRKTAAAVRRDRHGESLLEVYAEMLPHLQVNREPAGRRGKRLLDGHRSRRLPGAQGRAVPHAHHAAGSAVARGEKQRRPRAAAARRAQALLAGDRSRVAQHISLEASVRAQHLRALARAGPRGNRAARKP